MSKRPVPLAYPPRFPGTAKSWVHIEPLILLEVTKVVLSIGFRLPLFILKIVQPKEDVAAIFLSSSSWLTEDNPKKCSRAIF